MRNISLFILCLAGANSAFAEGSPSATVRHLPDQPVQIGGEGYEHVFDFGETGMDRIVTSWNIRTTDKCGVEIFIQAKTGADSDANGGWSEELSMAAWGNTGEANTHSDKDGGQVKTSWDEFKVKSKKDGGPEDKPTKFKVRVRAVPASEGGDCSGENVPELDGMTLAGKDSSRFREGDPAVPDFNGDIDPIKLAKYCQLGMKGQNKYRGCATACAKMIVDSIVPGKERNVDANAMAEDGICSTATDNALGFWNMVPAMLYEKLKAEYPDRKFSVYFAWHEDFDDILAKVQEGHPVMVSLKYRPDKDENGEPYANPEDKRPVLTDTPFYLRTTQRPDGKEKKPGTNGHFIVIGGKLGDRIIVRDPIRDPGKGESPETTYDYKELAAAYKGYGIVVEDLSRQPVEKEASQAAIPHHKDLIGSVSRSAQFLGGAGR